MTYEEYRERLGKADEERESLKAVPEKEWTPAHTKRAGLLQNEYERLDGLSSLALARTRETRKATPQGETRETREETPQGETRETPWQPQDAAQAAQAVHEDPELEAMRSEVRVAGFLAAALSGRPLTGREAEYSQELRVDGIPLSLFESRVDAPTVTPSTTGVNMQAVVPAVFARSIARRLGISMPRAQSGAYSVPRLTTNLTAGATAKGAARESTAAGFTVASATPKRVSARLTVQAEDIASFGTATFEASLRRNLSQVLSAELDTQILRGDGSAPNLRGLVTQLTAPTAASAVVTFASFASTIAGEIDGIFAESLRDLSFVSNTAVLSKLESTFSGTDAISVGDRMRSQLTGFYGHARMPASSNSNVASCLVRKSGAGVGATAEIPTWASLAIDDIYTDSAKAQRHFSVHAIVGDVILLHPDAYSLVSVKTA